MIASEKSTIALRYAVTLKNKALEAYKDLMNTPL
jgi:flagellar hook-basal body complex protein FliE